MKHLFFFAVLFLLSPLNFPQEQFKQIGDGIGEMNLLFCTDAGTLLTYTTKFYRSTNQGQTWVAAAMPSAADIVQAQDSGVDEFEPDFPPENANSSKMIQAGNGNLFYQRLISHDDGLSWQINNRGLIEPNTPINCFTIGYDGAVYAGTTGGGVVRYSSLMSGWESYTLQRETVKSVLILSINSIFAVRVHATEPVIRTNNGGYSWEPVDFGLSWEWEYWGDAMFYKNASGDLLMIGTFARYNRPARFVLYSRGTGVIWEERLAAPPDMIGAFTQNDNGLVFFSGGWAPVFSVPVLFRSEDGGYTWDNIKFATPDSLYRVVSIDDLCIFGSTLYGIGSWSGYPDNYGVTAGFSCNSSGNDFSLIRPGLIEKSVYAVLQLPNNKIFAASSKGVFHSASNGNDWSMSGPHMFSFSKISSDHLGNLFSIARPEQYGQGKFFVSTDQGFSWNSTEMTFDLSAIGVNKVGWVYAGLENPVGAALFCSNDLGYSWDFLPIYDKKITCMEQGLGNDMFIGTENGVYRLTNQNSTVELLPLTEGGFIYSLYYEESTNRLLVGYYDGIEILLDYGNSRGQFDGGPFSPECIVSNSHGVLVCKSEDYLYSAASTDHNWRYMSSDVTILKGKGTLFFDKDDYLYLSTTNEIDPFFPSTESYFYRSVNPVVTSADEIEFVPITFELEQNFPNPFNPSTTIRFALPQQEDVTLTIYDVNGNLVKTMLSETMPAGMHSAVWDGTDETSTPVSSGVYFYKLLAGKIQAVNKMILVK